MNFSTRLASTFAVTLATAATLSFACAGSARAEVVAGAEALPTGHVPVLMSSVFDARPNRLGAHEKIAGLKVEAQTNTGRGRRPSTTYITLTEAAGNGCFRSTDGSEFSRPRRGAAEPALRPFFDDSIHAMTTQWAPDGESMVPATVNLVRRELLVPKGDGTATLEVTDFWFDPVTRGARLIKKYEAPYRAIGKAFQDANIYAMRDGESFGVVIARPKSDGSADGVLSDDDRFSTRCLHISASLVSADSGNNMITLDEMIPVRTETPTRAEAKAQNVAATDKPHFQSILGKFARKRPVGAQAEEGEELIDNTIERVNRLFRVSVGISQFGTDKTPVISVSRGWIGGPVGSPFSGVD